jgi:hypothetical protein
VRCVGTRASILVFCTFVIRSAHMYLWLVFTIVNPVALFPNAEADSSSSYRLWAHAGAALLKASRLLRSILQKLVKFASRCMSLTIGRTLLSILLTITNLSAHRHVSLTIVRTPISQHVGPLSKSIYSSLHVVDHRPNALIRSGSWTIVRPVVSVAAHSVSWTIVQPSR